MQEITSQIREILSGRKARETPAKPKQTMFADVLDSKLPASEKTLIRLQNEAVGIVGAGLETTKWTLTVALYYILADPAIYTRLRKELDSAIPDPSEIPAWSELQRIPYLSACVEEGT